MRLIHGITLSRGSFRFNLSHQDIEDLLAQRGLVVSRGLYLGISRLALVSPETVAVLCEPIPGDFTEPELMDPADFIFHHCTYNAIRRACLQPGSSQCKLIGDGQVGLTFDQMPRSTFAAARAIRTIGSPLLPI